MGADFSGSQTKQDPKRISDEIRLIRAQQSATDWVLIITAITRSIVVVTVIISGFFLLLNGVAIPTPAWGIATLTVIGTFGLEGIAKWFVGKANGQ